VRRVGVPANLANLSGQNKSQVPMPSRAALFRSFRLAACLLCSPALAYAAAVPAPAAVQQIGNVMWNLSELYPAPEAWTASYERTKAEAEKLETYKGTLGTNAAAMLRGLDAISRVNRELSRLYTYASLKADEDLTIAANQERKQQAAALSTLVDEKTAWVAPEILMVGNQKVRRFQAQERALQGRFGYFLDNTLRAAPHTLGLEAEGVIAATGNVLQQPNAIYEQLSDAELPFPTVTLSDGTSVKLDQTAYTRYRQAPNRADRKLVFDSFWGAWKDFEGTAGSVLTTQVMTNIFRAKVRKHPNALASALFPDNMPEAVYRTLVGEANKGLPALHRYLRLRKRLLGIPGELEYYDSYPTMFRLAEEPKFTLADSERMTLTALAPYGSEYLGLLRQGFSGTWMNALPREHKASGAYMNGSAYDVHPYLLLNHNDDYDSLSTFAHEWGHAVHTLLTTKNQPFEKSNYSTFIAESASIANEMLLNDYMVANAKTKEEKLYYLGEGLESIRTTFFRQVMFAEFELAIHEEIEAGRPLSGSRLTELYCGLLRKYHGEAQGVMKINPAYCVEWEFIPHFYYNFYVYQYATSMAGAAQFTAAMQTEGAPASERFLTMLRAGGSDYPYEIYRRAGIDMATPAPYQALIARMTRTMDQIEELLRP
jgi:oligoendopeptidase F